MNLACSPHKLNRKPRNFSYNVKTTTVKTSNYKSNYKVIIFISNNCNIIRNKQQTITPQAVASVAIETPKRMNFTSNVRVKSC